MTQTLPELTILERDAFIRAGIDLLILSEAVVEHDNLRFHCLPKRAGQARLVNLLAWQLGDGVEVLDGAAIHADQVVHIATHRVMNGQLGHTDPFAMLAGEAVASASDIYLLGCLAAAGEETDFLADTLESFAMYCELYSPDGEQALERLLIDVRHQPFQTMAHLAQYLFASCTDLWCAHALENTIQAVSALADHPYYPLIHHYNATNWVLNTRHMQGAPNHRQRAQDTLNRLFRSEENFLNLYRDHCVK